MACRHPLRQRRGPRHLRRADRAHDRRRLRDLGRDGGRARALPRLRREPRAMLRVMRNHRRAAYGGKPTATRGCPIPPVPLDHAACPTRPDQPRAGGLGRGAGDGRAHGYRNAQATVIAPTGTIGLVMDCDTTGIEPDFALVKFKKLAGGGYFKIINRMVPPALGNPRLRRRADRRDRRATRSATARSTSAPAHQPRGACGQGLHRRGARQRSKRRCQPPSTSASSSTNARWARSSARDARHRRRPARRIPASTCWPRSASPRRRSTRPTPTSAAP